MGWIALAVLFAITVSWIAFRLRGGGTVYFSRPNGYRALTLGSESELRPVPLDRYDRILHRFIQGDLFDSIWIANHPKDDDGGLVLSLGGDEVEMTVSFVVFKEPERLAAFRQCMKSWGYAPVAEDPWNVGMGEDFESIAFKYRFERDVEQVRQVVERALHTLEGPAGTEVYVNAWRSQDGPGQLGIRVVPRQDILAEVP
jgi:hypothetical protein